MAESVKYYHKKRKGFIKELGGECENCGSKEKLEFHHIHETGESDGIGGWQQLYRIEREIKKGEIILLCKNCHLKYHGGYLNLEESE